MSIGRKFTLWIISVVFVVGLFSTFLYYNSQLQEETERLESLGNTIGPLLERSLVNYMLTRDSAALDVTLKGLTGVRPIRRILLLNSDGFVAASTDKGDVGSRMSEQKEECRGCHAKGRSGLYLKQERIFRWVQPVANETECHRCHNPSVRNNGIFIIDFSTSEFESSARKNIAKGFSIFFPSMGLIALIIFLLSGTIMKRLTAVTERIGRFKEGDYTIRAVSEGDDEITRVEEAFNAMAAAIHVRESELDLLFRQASRSYLEWQYTFDSIAELIAIIGTDFTIMRANRTFVEYFALADKEWRGRKCLDFFYGKEVEESECPLAAAMEENRPATEEIEGVEGRTFEISTFPYTYPDAEFRGAILVARDITDRKHAEKIIARNFDMQTVINSILKDAQEEMGLEDILQRAIEHILSLKWLSVRSMGSISLVESEPEILVMKARKNLPEQLVGMCASVRFGQCICGRAAAEKAVQYMDHVDHRHELCYGTARPHGHYCVPILYVDRTIGVLNIYLDEGTKLSRIEMDYFGAIAAVLAGIIQHKRAEEERERLIIRLREALNMVSRSQKEWQDTFDSITDLVTIHDGDYNIIKANRAAAEYFGLSPMEIVQRKCYGLFHQSDSEAANCPHKITLRENHAVTEEISDGKTGRIFRISTFPYYSNEGETAGTVHIARDITEEKNNEMRLIMSERLASLGQMASGIAHEINNPLAAIAGCTEGLLNRVGKGRYDQELFEKYLGIILEEISRCKHITSGMLSFIRKTTYEKKNIDLNRTIEKAMEIIGFQGRLQQITVVREFMEGLPCVPGSEGDLRQIFLTVITNALDSMSEKGTLTLKTFTEGTTVVVEISDTGNGIPSSEINRIFDPFFTTKSERGGTGLGLSIARKIVLNHNGAIDISSPGSGLGTTCRISFPFQQQG